MPDHQWLTVAQLSSFWARRAASRGRDALAMYYNALAICAHQALLRNLRSRDQWLAVLHITI